MADSEEQPIVPKFVKISGRVTPVDGIYRAGIPVTLSIGGNITDYSIYTDSDGYYEETIYDPMGQEVVAYVGNDSGTWGGVPVVWAPALVGETKELVLHSATESNEEVVGKGFLLKEGWENTGLWECSFEFRHEDIRYTGIIYLAKLGETYADSIKLSTYEGSFPNDDNYATYQDGTIDWFDITVTKIDETHIRVKSETLHRDSGIIEVTDLPNWEKLSIGACHNTSSNLYGPSSIRNVIVKKFLKIPSSIHVTSSKDILSYRDNDSATLTAQLLDENNNPFTVSNLPVTFEVRKESDDSLVETLTAVTDSSGIASVVYSSQGAGDLNIKVDCMSVSKIYGTIRDVNFYDAGSQSNLSKYDTTYNNNISFTYDSTNSAYKLQKTTNGFGTLILKDVSVSDNVKVEFDVMLGRVDINTQFSVRVANGETSIGSILIGYGNIGMKQHSLAKITGYVGANQGTTEQEQISSISANVWYHIELSVENGVWVSKFYQEDNLLSTLTLTDTSILSSTGNQILLSLGHVTNSNSYIKNIIVEEL